MIRSRLIGVALIPVFAFALLFNAAAQSTLAALPPSLTPPSPATPQIHGAKIIGTQFGHPFLYTIAATGQRPMTFSADGLPDGLKLDAATGQITGTIPPPTIHASALPLDDGKRGTSIITVTSETPVTLHARNALGEATRPLKIVAGDGIALTPPMGWNSWNCFGGSVTQDEVMAAADAMVRSGLADHGWTYINVDDCWQTRADAKMTRDAEGNILTNARFPDMKAMADHIHRLGLRAGLYSSPGPATCGGYTGSFGHEDHDAQQYAAWGFDYLKYDWCSYGDIAKKLGPPGVDGQKKPYEVMRDALAKADRDIVFSFCQYGMGDVWTWGAAAGGNSWRTTDDIRDNWKSMTANANRQAGLSGYAGPGHWNDPDMLVVGDVGWGSTQHASRLTPDEQYFHISMWVLQGAPLLIGCDLTKLDPFTLGLLTNDGVIDVDQDPLGKVADLVDTHGENPSTIQVWARPLEDGAFAVGLFNLGEAKATGLVSTDDLKISGGYDVRDLWRQQEISVLLKTFSTPIPAHGVVLVRLSLPQPGAKPQTR